MNSAMKPATKTGSKPVVTHVLLSIAVIALVSSSAWAGPRRIPTGAAPHLHVAQMGMGGVTSVIHTNSHTLFYNPALLNRQNFVLDITPVHVMYGDDLGNLVEWASDNADLLEDFDSLDNETQERILRDAEPFDNKWIGLNYSPYFGFASRGWGFGLYGVAHADMKVDGGVVVPAIGLRGYADTVVGLGYGFRQQIAGSDYELGATLRVVNRRQILPMRISATDASELEDLAETIVDTLRDAKTGFGLDVGAVRDFSLVGRSVTAAVVVQDLVGSLDGYLLPNVKFGGLYPLLPSMGNGMLQRIDVGLELNDFFNRQGISFFSRLNAGMEVSVLRGFLALRGGVHQGYPVYGAGLSVRVLRLDYAWFTEELGSAPGMYPRSGHRAQLSVGW